jgi:ATP-dependent helicase Lhr and Lhr-like helicase
MIEFQDEPYKDAQIFNELNPLVRSWFKAKFETFSPPQKYAVLNIHRRENTLISSPTGSGKTLSAFISIISELVGLSEKNMLEDRVYCVYISPLKALGNDIEKNLDKPLSEMEEMLKEKIKGKRGIPKALKELAKKNLNIRVGVRTGDTTQSDKSKMLRKPPHILITTPESFAIMLTSPKFREKFNSLEWVIVDEIHALANSKRGVHLSLSLERLQAMTNFCRIGLSATVSPLEEVAKFLVGMKDPYKGEFRDCKIVDVQFLKQLDLKVLSPVKNLITSSQDNIYSSMYTMIDKMIQDHKTTLIFTNTRSATERVVHHLKDRFPKNYLQLNTNEEHEFDKKEEEGFKPSFIGAHHGSLSKEHRLNIENRLKAGELKAVVSSTSLELGIDIGYIDLVILLGSPKSVARALQRIGRSGHKLHDKSKGRIIVLDRDDLVECSVLLKAALEKKIDRIDIPKNALDVLAQQIFGIAISDQISIEDLFRMVTSSFCYHSLDRKSFNEVISYLSGEYVSLEDRYVYAKIWYDKETGMIGKKGKMARVLYMTNIGTIPDETNVKVKIGAQLVGYIAEPFLERLKRGDVFVLGGDTYEFQYTRGLTAFVKASVDRPPTVPSWYSEMLPLSFDLALEIQKFRRFMEEHFDSGASKEDVIKFINDYLYVDSYGANSIYEYFKEQFFFSEISHDHKIVIEHYNEGDRTYAIFHTLFGRRVNDVLSRAVAFAVSKIHKKDAEMGISDNGFYIMINGNIQATRALTTITPDKLYEVMVMALDKTEVLNRRFRHCAGRGLMILRSYMGRTKSVGKQQRASTLLLAAVKRISPDFTILKEARREVLEDLMDINNAKKILESVEEGKISVKEVFTEIPSPFAFNLVAMGYSDIMKMEDKLKFLQRMHELVLAKISLEQGKKGKKFDFDFNPREMARESLEKQRSERDPEVERLKRQALDLSRVPRKVVLEIMDVIEGSQEEFSTWFKKGMKDYEKEIKKEWPKELREFVFNKL